MIAALPMYDWPEERGATETLWQRLCVALTEAGVDAPDHLTRSEDLPALWLSPDLLIAETCSWPLATSLAGQVRYVATLRRDAPGCADGFYRSVIVAKGADADRPMPSGDGADLPSLDGMTLAFNSSDSLSGRVALEADAGLVFGQSVETGSHRGSIRAVAQGQADIAAIDAYTWHLAKRHEPAASDLTVIGWTARRPALPLITACETSDADLARMRAAILNAVPAVVHVDPLAGLGAERLLL